LKHHFAYFKSNKAISKPFLTKPIKDFLVCVMKVYGGKRSCSGFHY